MRYHPYGQTAFRSGETPVYGFAGGEIEAESELGLVRFGARWYAPGIGRWVSGDLLYVQSPAKSATSAMQSGLYSYSLNNPVSFSDPSGGDTETQQSVSYADDQLDSMMDEQLGTSESATSLEKQQNESQEFLANNTVVWKAKEGGIQKVVINHQEMKRRREIMDTGSGSAVSVPSPVDAAAGPISGAARVSTRIIAKVAVGGIRSMLTRTSVGVLSKRTATSGDSVFGPQLAYKSLSSRIRNIHSRLPKSGSYALFSKKDVSMAQLKTLTRHTDDEYQMFTKGTQRLVIRGEKGKVGVSKEMYDDIVAGKYGKFSGHTHPSGHSLRPGPGDRFSKTGFYRLIATRISPTLRQTWNNRGYLVSQIVPVLDSWMLSGSQHYLNASEKRIAYGMAAEMAQNAPSLFFQNPENLKKALDMEQKRHQDFLDHFGSPWIVGAPREIEDRWRQFMVSKLDPEAAERMKSSINLPIYLYNSKSVGMIQALGRINALSRSLCSRPSADVIPVNPYTLTSMYRVSQGNQGVNTQILSVILNSFRAAG